MTESKNPVQTPKPLFDFVLIVREEKKLKSGLVLPEGSTQFWPVVAAAGPDCKFVKAGDRVMLDTQRSYGAFDWDRRYNVLHENELCCLLPGEAPEPDLVVTPTGEEKAIILQ